MRTLLAGWILCAAARCSPSSPGGTDDADAVDQEAEAGTDAGPDQAPDGTADGTAEVGEGEESLPGDVVDDDAGDGFEVPCPPGDLCGPGEYWRSDIGRCWPDCYGYDACTNPCPDDAPICGCGWEAPWCGRIVGCYCNDDYQCQGYDPDGDPCTGGFWCEYGCMPYPAIECPAGEVCNPERVYPPFWTWACEPA